MKQIGLDTKYKRTHKSMHKINKGIKTRIIHLELTSTAIIGDLGIT